MGRRDFIKLSVMPRIQTTPLGIWMQHRMPGVLMLILIHWLLFQLTYFNTGIWALGIDLISRVLDSNRNKLYTTVLLAQLSTSPESGWIIMTSLLTGRNELWRGLSGALYNSLELSSSSFHSTSQSQEDRNGTQIWCLSKETVYEHRLRLLHREYSWS